MATAATTTSTGSDQQALARRLWPLQVGIALQSMVLWLPVEKMFMTQIGFDAAGIGLVAAVYAGVAPTLEVPFGILADRWSRSGILSLASVALAASSLAGGLSTTPVMYVVAAALLGVYFALSSGVADSIVYDTVIEETGSSDAYERWIGRVHVVTAVALATSALLGGLLAALVSARATYFATVPLVALAIVALHRFREPQLHRKAEPVSFRVQAVATVRVLTTDRALRPVVLLTALAAMVAMVVFEFGPLWLVALHAPAALYGPYWAALVATIGLGGWLASRVHLERPPVATALAVTLALAAAVPVASRSLPLVIAAQVVVALAAAMIGVRAGRLLHDGVGAHLRAGVSSGAGTLTWLTFLPLSVVFGQVSRAQGVQTAGLLLVLFAAVVALLLARTARRDPAPAVATRSLRAARARATSPATAPRARAGSHRGRRVRRPSPPRRAS